EQGAARVAQAKGDSEPDVPACPQTGCNHSHTYATSHWRPSIRPEGNQAPHSEAQGRPNHRDPFRLEQGEADSCDQEIGDGGDDRESYHVSPRLLRSALSEHSTLDLFAEPLRNRWHFKTASLPLPRTSNRADHRANHKRWAGAPSGIDLHVHGDARRRPEHGHVRRFRKQRQQKPSGEKIDGGDGSRPAERNPRPPRCTVGTPQIPTKRAESTSFLQCPPASAARSPRLGSGKMPCRSGVVCSRSRDASTRYRSKATRRAMRCRGRSTSASSHG